MLVQKINENWRPSGHPNLAVGEIVEITDAANLIKEGLVRRVELKGTQQEAKAISDAISESSEKGLIKPKKTTLLDKVKKVFKGIENKGEK